MTEKWGGLWEWGAGKVVENIPQASLVKRETTCINLVSHASCKSMSTIRRQWNSMKACHNHMIFITWISSPAEVCLGTGFNALTSSPSSHSQKCCFATSIICKWWFRVKRHFVREQWRSRLKRNRQQNQTFCRGTWPQVRPTRRDSPHPL